jgi:Glucose / Sorbosone dehydrogenase
MLQSALGDYSLWYALATFSDRVRDVRQSPDGYIYFVTDANPDGAILRIEPAAPQPTTSAQR